MLKFKSLTHQFNTEFIGRLDPDYDYLKQAIRTGLAALISVLIYRYHSHWSQAYWVILAAVFLMQTRLGDTQCQQSLTLLICGVCTVILTYVVGFFWHHTLLLALFMAITTFLSIYLGQLGVNFAIGGFFVNLFIVMSAGLPTTPGQQLQRAGMILLGTLIAFLLSFLFYTKPQDRWRRALKVYLLCVSEFSELIGKSYSDPHYQQNRLKFEYRFHERRNRCLRRLNALRHAFRLIRNNQPPAISDQHTQTLEALEYLYNSLLALANIRHRLSDTLIDSSFYNDLIKIHRLLATCLNEIALKNSRDAIDLLSAQIHQLRHKIMTQDTGLQEPWIAFIHTATTLPQELNTISFTVSRS